MRLARAGTEMRSTPLGYAKPMGLASDTSCRASQWRHDAAQQFVSDHFAHLRRVCEVPAAGFADERQDAAGEVFRRPPHIDAFTQPAGRRLPSEVRLQERGD